MCLVLSRDEGFVMRFVARQFLGCRVSRVSSLVDSYRKVPIHSMVGLIIRSAKKP